MKAFAVALIAVVACAPRVDGPVAEQRAADRADAARLSAQIGALPGVVRTELVLQRATRDPLSSIPASLPVLSTVVVVDDRADRAAVTARVRELATAVAPDIAPTIVVEVGAVRPVLARVGPFEVEARSQKPLKATLASVLALVALLSGAIAVHHARRVRRR